MSIAHWQNEGENVKQTNNKKKKTTRKWFRIMRKTYFVTAR